MVRLLAITALSAVLYTYALDRVPAYLTLDEAHFSVHAHAIAETGRNLNGQILPLLISLEDPEGERYELPWGHTYYLPFGIYLIAGALQVLPLDEATVRLPSALLGGVVNVLLIYAVAMALFRDRLAAAGSAALLALAPANLILSRQALDSVAQLPFTLGFLWCLATYLRRPDPRLALAAGAILGAGLYAYVTSTFFMPLFLALFWVMAWRAGTLDRRAWAWSVAGFAAALLPMALWLLWHPEAFHSLRIQYNRADPGSATLMATLADGGVTAAAREFVRIYWSYFDPSFLFVQGGNTRTTSTGEVGVFLMPVALLAPWGLLHLRARPQVRLLLLILLLTAPLPAAIKGTPFAIQRGSGLLIVVSLMAGAGLAALWSSGRRGPRAAAAALGAVMLWQFAGFAADYHGGYRARSSHVYDPTAFGGAAGAIVAAHGQQPITTVYLPAGLYDMSAKWRFYATKHGLDDLWTRTVYYGAGDGAMGSAVPGSVAVVTPPVVMADAGAWSVVAEVSAPSGVHALTVLRRTR